MKNLVGSETVEVIIHSVNFGEIKKFTEADDWKKLLEIMRNAAIELEAAGAGCLLIGANTMHRIADEIQAAIKIPVIHIAELLQKIS
jgi:aspartate racemase